VWAVLGTGLYGSPAQRTGDRGHSQNISDWL